MTTQRIEKFGSVPSYLGTGDLWATKKLGTFVVIGTQPAKWRGDDRDVYAHVDTWYTIRSATAEEQQLWDAAVSATQLRKRQREEINLALGNQHPSYGYVTNMRFSGNRLIPSDNSTRRLDSYDDRWEPPQPIALTPEQVAVEVAAEAAIKACSGRPVVVAVSAVI